MVVSEFGPGKRGLQSKFLSIKQIVLLCMVQCPGLIPKGSSRISWALTPRYTEPEYLCSHVELGDWISGSLLRD